MDDEMNDQGETTMQAEANKT